MADEKPPPQKAAHAASNPSTREKRAGAEAGPHHWPTTDELAFHTALRSFRSLLDSPRDGIAASPDLQRQVADLQQQIAQLQVDVAAKTEQLREQQLDSAFKDGYIETLTEDYDSLVEKQALAHLLDRVGPEAQERLFRSQVLRGAFEREGASPAYVISIDIRRSTELMLKAREPRLFAQFIVSLAASLKLVVTQNHGVFDKFTGDGILAFFPKFYSGEDAGYFALSAAKEAHAIFRSHYDAHRHCFVAVIRDAGLGVGIDYGAVNIVHLGSEFTVVGTPVVYACRMAGAKAGLTYLNQAAYEDAFAKYSAICDFNVVELDVKNEGVLLAYSASLKNNDFKPAPPAWQTLADDAPVG